MRKEECGICSDEIKFTLLQFCSGCGHGLCGDCFDRLATCPFCRQPKRLITLTAKPEGPKIGPYPPQVLQQMYRHISRFCSCRFSKCKHLRCECSLHNLKHRAKMDQLWNQMTPAHKRALMEQLDVTIFTFNLVVSN